LRSRFSFFVVYVVVFYLASNFLTWAQNAHRTSDFPVPPSRPGPQGAVPGSSGAAAPEPEAGSVESGLYRNDYFGLSYPLLDGWREDYKGPIPSSSGIYSLLSLRPQDDLNGTLVISAQDWFFDSRSLGGALKSLRQQQHDLGEMFQVERVAVAQKIGSSQFARLDYSGAGLIHANLAIDVRCHTLNFNITSRNPKVIERLVQTLSQITFPVNAASGGGKYPICVKDYATGSNVIHFVDPEEAAPKFTSVPVRIVIDEAGKVKHIHVISAFPAQARNIEEALAQWTFKPYMQNGQAVEIETGLLFEFPPRHPNASNFH